LEQGNAHNHPAGVFDPQQSAFHTGQRALIDPNSLVDSEPGPRRQREPGTDQDLQAGDFRIGDGRRHIPETNDRSHARRPQDLEPFLTTKPAEDVSREEREIQFLDPVGPPAPRTVERKEFLEILMAESRSYRFFVLGSYDESVPPRQNPLR
jgi:hypothetical protein